MHIVWWYWICLGLFFLLAEAMTPGGFYLFFIGVAAIIVGVLAVWLHPAWIQLTLFAVLSAVLIATLRKPLNNRVKRSTRQADTPEFIGETGRIVEAIGPGMEGKIELRGSIWAARNGGQVVLPENCQCTVVAREGLKMVVEKKQESVVRNQ
jgi:inner membrane protein